jgi:hypothetical protein
MNDTKIVQIFVWRGKAYVPAQGRMEGGGPFLTIEPVVTVDLARDAIVGAIKSALSVGHPSVPRMTRVELDRRISPILAATGARNWGEFYRGAVLYVIEWGPTGTYLQFSNQGPKGGWLFDAKRRRDFPREVDIGSIVDVIMEDIHSRKIPKATAH